MPIGVRAPNELPNEVGRRDPVLGGELLNHAELVGGNAAGKKQSAEVGHHCV
jgi:hypothetical protein